MKKSPSRDGVVVSFAQEFQRRRTLTSLDAQLGRAIAAVRRQKRLTHAALEARSALSSNTLSACEAGSVRISASMLVRIARALEVPPSTLLAAAQAD